MYLGFLPGVEYPNKDVQLSPGDAVLLYSDGATEIDGDNGMVGSERLGEWIGQARADALSPEATLQQVRSSLSEYSMKNGHVTAFDDDVTLILVSLKAPGAVMTAERERPA
jgi:serine phosphatase RsbU (regulator of sigma subunit)